jgi:hypothetical protein
LLLIDHVEIVRFHSAGVQAMTSKLPSSLDFQPIEKARMMTSPRRVARPEALDEEGRLLVFAPPLMTGFLGSPLALALARGRTERPDGDIRRNWAKRRAY